MYIALPDSEGWWRGAGPAAPPAPPGSHDVAGQSINMDLFKAKSVAKQALPETAFGPKQPLALARRQVDLEVSEFCSSKSDWLACARIAKHNKTI